MTFYPSRLSENHQRTHIEGSGIDSEVAAERGYRTVTRPLELPAEFKDYQRRSGLLIPVSSPSGKTGHRLRADRPRKGKDKKPRKYEQPADTPNMIDVHPRNMAAVRDPGVDLWITEGEKKADSLTSRGLCTVALFGVWGWCVTGTKGRELLPCWDHMALDGRRVYVVFDADVMTKENVQLALERLVTALEARGADVRVIYLPDAADGSKQGVDDYLAVGHTVAELKMLARKFEPADVGRIRLSRDDKLRAAVGYLWPRWREGDWMKFVGKADKGNWQRGHTARDTMEALIELATRHGKPDDRGVVVEVGLRRLSELAAKTAPSIGAAVKHLEADGQLEILPSADKAKPRRYRLLAPRAALYSMERGGREEESNKEVTKALLRCKGLRAPSAPRLRWSSPVRLARLVRRVEPTTGRTLTEAVGENVFIPPDHRPYAKRLGPHRCAVLDALEAAGGELHLADLCEALHRKRPRDVRRRILEPLEEAGIIEREGGVIRLAAEWLVSLDARREADGEIEQAEKQVRKHRSDGERYRSDLARKRHGTPKASGEAVDRGHELRERRLREIRAREERNRDAALRAFRATMGSGARKNLEQFLDGTMTNVELLVKSVLAYHRRPFAEWGEWRKPVLEAGRIIAREATPEPEPEPASHGAHDAHDWRGHPLACECPDCAAAPPRYARPCARGVA